MCATFPFPGTSAAEAAAALARTLMGHPEAAAREVLDQAAAVARVPAPPLAEEARARAVLGMIGAGAARDAAGNVVWRLPGRDDGPPVVLAAHLDTVFGEDVPVEPRREGGRLLAPGIGDNGLGVAAALWVGRRLAGVPRAREVVVCLTRGEEGRGDLLGARAAVEHLRPGVLLAVEGHFLDRVSCVAVGSERMEARFRGPGGHSWGDRGAPSATHGLCLAGARLARLAPGPDASVSIGVVAGGTSVNALAAEARLELDLRAEDPGTLAGLAALARAALADGAAEAGVGLEVVPIGRRPAGRLDPGHPLPVLLRAVRAATGLPPADESGVSTDANAALGAGVPAACLGITQGGGMHTATEWVDERPVPLGLLQLLAATLALAGPPPPG